MHRGSGEGNPTARDVERIAPREDDRGGGGDWGQRLHDRMIAQLRSWVLVNGEPRRRRKQEYGRSPARERLVIKEKPFVGKRKRKKKTERERERLGLMNLSGRIFSLSAICLNFQWSSPAPRGGPGIPHPTGQNCPLIRDLRRPTFLQMIFFSGDKTDLYILKK